MHSILVSISHPPPKLSLSAPVIYINIFILFPSPSCTFLHLLSCDSGDVCSLIFNHDDLNANPLTFSLGCAVTLSSRKEYCYPTIHFAYLSTKKLSLKVRTFTKVLLRLHSEHIIISAKNI